VPPPTRCAGDQLAMSPLDESLLVTQQVNLKCQHQLSSNEANRKEGMRIWCRPDTCSSLSQTRSLASSNHRRSKLEKTSVSRQPFPIAAYMTPKTLKISRILATGRTRQSPPRRLTQSPSLKFLWVGIQCRLLLVVERTTPSLTSSVILKR